MPTSVAEAGSGPQPANPNLERGRAWSRSQRRWESKSSAGSIRPKFRAARDRRHIGPESLKPPRNCPARRPCARPSKSCSGTGRALHEHSRVTNFSRSSPITIRTDRSTLSARRLVIANNAWATSIRELQCAIVVVSSDIVATKPIPERLAEIGWDKDLSITDSQTMVDYYRITRDGRIAFGKGGWTIAYGGRIGANFDRHAGRAAEVTADLRRYYPMLNDVPVTHDWSGPIDRTPDSLPRLGRLKNHPNIIYGIGWSGNGVGRV